MYEVELKVEITKEEREKLLFVLENKNFIYSGMTPLNDYYIEGQESPYGGYNIKRYRQEDGKVIYTEKTWVMVGDTPSRKEDEHEVSIEVFNKEIAKFPNLIKIHKERDWFSGIYDGLDMGIMIDSVRFDHSVSTRYFIEAEVIVSDENKVKKIRGEILKFLQDLLDKPEIKEAHSMFSMALNKK